MAGGAKKVGGWLWVVAFYAFVLVAGIALAGGGTVLATFALGVLRSDASWHTSAGIAHGSGCRGVLGRCGLAVPHNRHPRAGAALYR